MKVTNKIDIHLDDLKHIPPVDVMQADAYTRILEFALYSGGQTWKVPAGVDVAVAYSGSGGKGIYDTLPDGSAACTVAGNVVTAVVVPQALAMHGNVQLTVVFTDNNEKQLAAFCVTLRVAQNPAVNATRPPDYINLRQWMTEELLSQLHQANTIAQDAMQKAAEYANDAQDALQRSEDAAREAADSVVLAGSAVDAASKIATSAKRYAETATEAAERAVKAAESVGSGGNLDVSIDGEILVIAENSAVTIENETLIL
jgi:hypothetical protein